MFIDMLHKINKNEIKEFDDSILEIPLSGKKLAEFIKESRIVLGFTPCDEYIELLKISNGFDWDGCFFYNHEDFLYQNIGQQKLPNQKNFILYGNSGNMVEYTQNTTKKTFDISRMFCIEQSLQLYDNFGDLFEGVFNESVDEYINNKES